LTAAPLRTAIQGLAHLISFAGMAGNRHQVGHSFLNSRRSASDNQAVKAYPFFFCRQAQFFRKTWHLPRKFSRTRRCAGEQSRGNKHAEAAGRSPECRRRRAIRKRCGKAPASELSRWPNRVRPESCSAASFHQAPTLPLKRTPGDGRRAFFITEELIYV
jgi:hypothetical protein